MLISVFLYVFISSFILLINWFRCDLVGCNYIYWCVIFSIRSYALTYIFKRRNLWLGIVLLFTWFIQIILNIWKFIEFEFRIWKHYILKVKFSVSWCVNYNVICCSHKCAYTMDISNGLNSPKLMYFARELVTDTPLQKQSIKNHINFFWTDDLGELIVWCHSPIPINGYGLLSILKITNDAGYFVAPTMNSVHCYRLDWCCCCPLWCLYWYFSDDGPA